MVQHSTSVRARLAQFAAARLHERHVWVSRFAAIAAMTMASGVIVEAAAAVRESPPKFLEQVVRAPAPEPKVTHTTVIRWLGKDLDGDGAADFVNPTGQAPRVHDAYGFGHFGARRDGGARAHEGVDFAGVAGQTVVAPMSGYVTKIGYAYAGDSNLRFVEISNPALRYEARVFYVDPTVEVGQAVQLGAPIGTLHSLQKTYPGGMTDHAHLEIITPKGRIDATKVIVARLVRETVAQG